MVFDPIPPRSIKKAYVDNKRSCCALQLSVLWQNAFTAERFMSSLAQWRLQTLANPHGMNYSNDVKSPCVGQAAVPQVTPPFSSMRCRQLALDLRVDTGLAWHKSRKEYEYLFTAFLLSSSLPPDQASCLQIPWHLFRLHYENIGNHEGNSSHARPHSFDQSEYTLDVTKTTIHHELH